MTEGLKGIILEIGGDASGLDSALQGVEKQSVKLQSELKGINSLLKLDPGNTELIAQKQLLLAKNIENTAEKLKALESVQSKMKTANEANADWEKSFAPIKKSIDETKEKLKALHIQQEKASTSLASGKISQNQYDAIQKDIDETKEKLKQLNTEKKKLDASFEDGHIDDASYRNFQREIEATRIKLNRLKNEQNGTDDIGKGFKEASKEAKNLGDSVSETSAITVAKGQLMADAFKKVATELISIAENTREYRQELSMLSTNAEQAGANFDVVKSALRDLNAITGENDSNIEALSNLMRSGFNDNQMLKTVEALSGAVIQFPDTLKIESLADSLQETLGGGKSIGQFDELLSRLGVNLEGWNKGFQEAIQSGEQYNYILDTLANSGLANVNKAYRDTNQVLIESANAQFDLNDAMAEIGQKAEPLITAFKENFAEFLIENLPEIEKSLEKAGTAFLNIVEVAFEFKDVIIAGTAAMVAFKAAIAIGNVIAGVVKAIQILTIAQNAATVAQVGFNVAAYANPYVVIAAVIAAAIAALVAFTLAAEKTVTVTDKINDYNKAMESAKETANDIRKNGKLEIDVIKKKADRYEELRQKVNRTAEEEKLLANLASELQQVMPGNITLIDKKTGAYKALGDNIDNVIAKEKASLELDYLKSLAEEAKTHEKELQDVLNAIGNEIVEVGRGGAYVDPVYREIWEGEIKAARAAIDENQKYIDDYLNAYEDFSLIGENKYAKSFQEMGSDGVKSAIEYAEKRRKELDDAYAKEKKALDRQLARNLISTEEYYRQYNALTLRYNTQKEEFEDDYYKYQQDLQEDNLKKQQELQEKFINSKKDALQAEKDKLQEINSERQRAVDIEQALQDLENARKNKSNKVYYADRGLVDEINKKDVQIAENKIKDLAVQKEVDSIDKLINALDKNSDNAVTNADAYLKNVDTSSVSGFNPSSIQNIIDNMSSVTNQLSTLNMDRLMLPSTATIAQVQKTQTPPITVNIDYDIGDIIIQGNANTDTINLLMQELDNKFNNEFKGKVLAILEEVLSGTLLQTENH